MGREGWGWSKPTGRAAALAAVAVLSVAPAVALEPALEVSTAGNSLAGMRPAPLASWGRTLLVVHHDAAYVVLSTKARADWSARRATRLAHPSLLVVSQRVEPGRLPRDLRGWTSGRFELYRGARVVCRARVTERAVLTRMYPDLYTVPGRRRPRPAELLRKAKLLGAQRLLVGKVVPVGGGSCAGATWARALQTAAPEIFTRAARMPRRLRRRALEAFRSLVAYGKLQREYHQQIKNPPARRWDAYRGAQVEVAWYRSANDGRSLVVVSARSGEGCGDFLGEHWAAWEVVSREGAQQLVRRTPDRPRREFFVPDTIVGSAGALDLVGGDVLVHARSRAAKRLTVRVPSHMCSC